MAPVRDSSAFIEGCRRVFGGWSAQYGLTEHDTDASLLAPYFLMKSDTAFASVTLERRDSWVRLFLGHLQADGSVPPFTEPIAQAQGSERWIDLTDYVKRRGRRLGMGPIGKLKDPENPKALDAALLRLRRLAEDHASEALRGGQ